MPVPVPPPVIDSLPLPAPAPAPTPAPVRVANPLIGLAPGLVAAPAGLQLAVIDGGLRLPVIQVADAAPVVEERPIRRAGSEVGENAFLPTAVKPVAPKPAAPVVPVYPRKPARH